MRIRVCANLEDSTRVGQLMHLVKNNDGAAATVLLSDAMAKKLGVDALGRLCGFAVAGATRVRTQGFAATSISTTCDRSSAV